MVVAAFDQSRDRRIRAPGQPSGDAARPASGRGRVPSAHPTWVGGSETPLTDVLRIDENFGRIDASVGLLVWNANYGFMGALLSESGAAQIWGGGAEPTLANSGMPGAAVPVDGGYRLSGQRKIVSGIHAADWFIAVGVVTENGQPRITQACAPDIRLCAVRRDQLKVDDTWNVSGMRGAAPMTCSSKTTSSQRIW